MLIRVKVYIDKYDVQGEDVIINTDDIKSKDDWNITKQKLIQDFIDKFNIHFKDKYKQDFEDFGKGTYKDNKQNRLLKRVGMEYDRGSKLRDKLSEINRNKLQTIQNEQKVLDNIRPIIPLPTRHRKRWIKEEIDFLKDVIPVKRIKRDDYMKLSEILNRTIPAIQKKLWKLRRSV